MLERYPPARYNVYTIDLDQDGAPDFIVESKKEWETRFVKSDLSRDGWNKLNASLSDGFAYLYFARLDRDLLKLFFLAGDEDYSDFSLRELDPETWKREHPNAPAKSAPPYDTLVVELKFGRNRERILTDLKRVSKPGRRIYARKDRLPRVLGGMGTAILSTSSGLVTSRTAQERGIGGEVICYVW